MTDTTHSGHRICTRELETRPSSTTHEKRKGVSLVKISTTIDRPLSGKRKATSEPDVDHGSSPGREFGGKQEGTDEGTEGPAESECTASQSAELLKESNGLDNTDPRDTGDTVGLQQSIPHMTEIPNPELWPPGFWPSEDAVAFSDPFSGDFTLAQHEQREIIQSQIGWNEDNEGPGSMVHSHTSDGTELYPAVHAASSFLLQDDLERWEKELEYDDNGFNWEDLHS